MDTTKIKYDEKYIVEQYNIGRNTNDLAQELGTYNTTIRRILLRNNIPLRTINHDRGYINSNPFLGEGADYWLGLIASDGNVSTITNKIRLNSNLDLDMLQAYCKFLGDPRVKVLVTWNQAFECKEYCVGFSHKETKEYLISIGITPRKSKTLEYLKPMTMDFIRGVLDGDGTVTPKGHPKLFTASKAFAYQLYEYLHIYEPTIRLYIGMWDVSIYKKDKVKQFYSDLYKNGGFYLERKKRKFGLDDI